MFELQVKHQAGPWETISQDTQVLNVLVDFMDNVTNKASPTYPIYRIMSGDGRVHAQSYLGGAPATVNLQLSALWDKVTKQLQE